MADGEVMLHGMHISKSSRHAKITGDFGEKLVMYWLSKHGFECASVDHTGIDLIARNPHKQEVMGISVKCRSRTPGTDDTYLRIPSDNISKAEMACAAFGCIPYFAIVIDAGGLIRVFVTSMEHLLKLFPLTPSGIGWRMSKEHLARYAKDTEVIAFEFQSETKCWWQGELGAKSL